MKRILCIGLATLFGYRLPQNFNFPYISQSVTEFWKRFYEKPEAPFSWQPEQVQVLESGELALSNGPVRDSEGKLFATFTSIWRRELPGQWRIVFDKGERVCDCAKP